MIELIGKLFTIVWPLWITGGALRVLKNGPDRDLVLPTPFMMFVTLSQSQHTDVSLCLLFPWSLAVVVLLYACRRQKRRLASWATLVCGAVAVYVQVDAAWITRSPGEPSWAQPTRL